ncbi:DUF4179 domain-containing protein [Clostridium estertheticum]|uniref:DUF4179 domain-containing protein n=1 Tax=Clostridium estertheticum TaxID=238834 RepID=UPI001C0E4ADE|nr:DUF4179 domain-containing protein [Clostridium estertheticum]MBU3183308.1 DUF4179 domain-containing protein [Clostridium estertheticum]
MKDIYELLNDVNIDESEMDEYEVNNIGVSSIEKLRIKKTLRNAIKKNKPGHKKAIIAAGLFFAMIGCAGTIGIANPTYATDIPIVGDIFRFLDNDRTGVYDKYKENANEINVTKESNGNSITIKDAIFDGRTLTYTYEIKSNKDLGKNPSFGGDGIEIEDYRGGLTGSAGAQRVNKNTYVGQDTYTIDEQREKINFQLKIKRISDGSNGEVKEANEATGNWKFKISLPALKSTKQAVNKGIEKEGIKINIDSISKTTATFSINFSQSITKEEKEKWFDVSTKLEVRDNLGNVYKGEDNGASGYKNTLNFRETFGKLDDKAQQLIITPKIHMSNTGGGVETDKNGKETEIKAKTDKNHPEKGDIILDNIVVNLDK